MICVGRCRLPRCQATRTRWCGSLQRISASGSGAATTSISLLSSSTSASPPRSATAFSRSSRNSSPRVPVIAIRRRWRSSKSSTTVSAGASVQRCCARTWVARIMPTCLQLLDLAVADDLDHGRQGSLDGSFRFFRLDQRTSTFSGVMISILGGEEKHFTAIRPNAFMCSALRCGTSASAFSHCSTNTILEGSVTLSCRS